MTRNLQKRSVYIIQNHQSINIDHTLPFNALTIGVVVGVRAPAVLVTSAMHETGCRLLIGISVAVLFEGEMPI